MLGDFISATQHGTRDPQKRPTVPLVKTTGTASVAATHKDLAAGRQ